MEKQRAKTSKNQLANSGKKPQGRARITRNYHKVAIPIKLVIQ